MSKSIPIFLVSFMSLALFTGCKTSTQSNINDTQPSPDSTLQQEESIVVTPSVQDANTSIATMTQEEVDIINQAALEQDISLCQNIANQFRSSCEARVNAELELQARAAEQEAEVQGMMADLQTIIQQKDASKCQQIEDENLRGDCEFNILVDTVIGNEDSALCDSLADEEKRSQCVDAFELATAEVPQ